MNGISYVIFIYIGIFGNLYIWEQGHKIADISWFNFVLFFTWAFAFTTGAYLLTKYTIRLLLGLSAFSSGLAFLVLSLIHLDNRFLWIATIGIPVGAMWGFFSAAQNLALSLVAQGRQFAHFFSVSNVVSQTLSITVPIVSALVIQKFGYSGSFVMMLVLVGIMLAVSRILPKLTLEAAEEKGNWLRQMAWKRVFSSPSTRWIALSCAIAGIFLQFQGLFSLVLTFSVTQNKMWIAALNVGYTASSISALWLYRRIRIKDQTWLIIGTLLITAGFSLLFYPYALSLIASNIMTTMGMFYFSTVWNSQQYNSISHFSSTHKARLLAWRESTICATRCMMLFTFLFVQDLHGMLFIFLIVTASASVLSIPFLQFKSAREVQNSQSETFTV